MSSISSVGSGSSLDTPFAQSLIQQSGSSDGTLNETEFIQLLKSQPQLAQGLASVEGGDSSTTIDQLYQKLDTDGDGSISLSELGTALGSLREKMQAAGGPPPPPPPSADSGAATGQTGTDSTATSDVTGSTTVGQLTGSGGPGCATDSSTSSGLAAATGLSSTSDLASIVSLLEQLLQQMQTQGYDQNGTATNSGSVTFFQTSS